MKKLKWMLLLIVLCGVTALFVYLLKKDNTYKPAADDFYADYNVQYIRTDGYHEQLQYPIVKIIRSTSELTAYYNANKDNYYLERREKIYSDSTIGFLDACDKYDAEYFQNQILIMVLVQEGSGSVRHKVESVIIGADNTCTVNINTIVPETGTDDMAQWHILIEPQPNVNIASESDVIVYTDGINPESRPITAQDPGASVDNCIDKDSAILLAKQKVTVEYDEISANFDTEKNIWKITFYKSDVLGGDQSIIMTHEGKIIDVKYGE